MGRAGAQLVTKESDGPSIKWSVGRSVGDSGETVSQVEHSGLSVGRSVGRAGGRTRLSGKTGGRCAQHYVVC